MSMRPDEIRRVIEPYLQERLDPATVRVCATIIGARPVRSYGSFDEQLKVQRASVDMAAALRGLIPSDADNAPAT